MYKDLIVVASAAVAADILFCLGERAYTRWREGHPPKPKAVFIDPRSGFEKFMNSFEYYPEKEIYNTEFGDWLPYNPWPNPNPDTAFGRFASKRGYFKPKR